jgi:hypothetical protein
MIFKLLVHREDLAHIWEAQLLSQQSLFFNRKGLIVRETLFLNVFKFNFLLDIICLMEVILFLSLILLIFFIIWTWFI